jgi:proteic killer suppression protein
MEIDFRDENLDRLETEAAFTAGFDKAIVKAFRKRMQVIRSVKDERDLYAVKGNHFEKLKGNRAHQHSLRLNDQWRLVVEIQSGTPKNTVTVVSIEDYH